MWQIVLVPATIPKWNFLAFFSLTIIRNSVFVQMRKLAVCAKDFWCGACTNLSWQDSARDSVSLIEFCLCYFDGDWLKSTRFCAGLCSDSALTQILSVILCYLDGDWYKSTRFYAGLCSDSACDSVSLTQILRMTLCLCCLMELTGVVRV